MKAQFIHSLESEKLYDLFAHRQITVDEILKDYKNLSPDCSIEEIKNFFLSEDGNYAIIIDSEYIDIFKIVK